MPITSDAEASGFQRTYGRVTTDALALAALDLLFARSQSSRSRILADRLRRDLLDSHTPTQTPVPTPGIQFTISAFLVPCYFMAMPFRGGEAAKPKIYDEPRPTAKPLRKKKGGRKRKKGSKGKKAKGKTAWKA